MTGGSEKYLKPEVINQIKRLDLRAQFVVKGFLQGLHSSPLHGFSVEFSEHREYRRIVERHGASSWVRLEQEAALLKQAGIDVIESTSTGRLSRYVATRRRNDAPIFVRDRLPGLRRKTVRRLEDASQVFERFRDAHSIARLYVAPEDRERAGRILGMKS